MENRGQTGRSPISICRKMGNPSVPGLSTRPLVESDATDQTSPFCAACPPSVIALRGVLILRPLY